MSDVKKLSIYTKVDYIHSIIKRELDILAKKSVDAFLTASDEAKKLLLDTLNERVREVLEELER